MPTIVISRKSRPDCYHKACDSRKRRVRGLWQWNGKCDANLTVPDDLGRKTSRFVPLNGAGFTEAEADYDRLRSERDDGRICPWGHTPALSDYPVGIRRLRLDWSSNLFAHGIFADWPTKTLRFRKFAEGRIHQDFEGEIDY